MRFDFSVLCCDVFCIQPNIFIRLSRVSSFFMFFFCRFALISNLYFDVFVFDLGNFGDLIEILCDAPNPGGHFCTLFFFFNSVHVQ